MYVKCVAELFRPVKVEADESDLCPYSAGHLRAPAVPSMIQHIILEHLLCVRLCTKHQGHRTKQSSQFLPSQSLLFSREIDQEEAVTVEVQCSGRAELQGGKGDMGQCRQGRRLSEEAPLSSELRGELN